MYGLEYRRCWRLRREHCPGFQNFPWRRAMREVWNPGYVNIVLGFWWSAARPLGETCPSPFRSTMAYHIANLTLKLNACVEPRVWGFVYWNSDVQPTWWVFFAEHHESIVLEGVELRSEEKGNERNFIPQLKATIITTKPVGNIRLLVRSRSYFLKFESRRIVILTLWLYDFSIHNTSE